MKEQKPFWNSVSIEIADLLKTPLPELLASGVIIKSNNVRRVFRCGNYFIKADYRKSHSFEDEFKTGVALKYARIPVVEHLAYGFDDSANYLITRAENDASEFSTFVENAELSDELLNTLTEFVRTLAESSFVHTDFHPGNLLYDPGKKRFILVDVRAVRRKFFWEKYFLPSGSFQIFAALRHRIDTGKMVDLLKKSGIRLPGIFFEIMLRREKRRLFKEWSRRKKQLFSNYAKFVRKEDNLIIRTRLPQPLEKYDKVPHSGAKEIFALGLFLELAGIPHTSIGAWNPESSEFYFLPPTPGTPSPKLVREFRRKLNICQLDLPNELWSVNSDNLPCISTLDALDHLIKQPLFAEDF